MLDERSVSSLMPFMYARILKGLPIIFNSDLFSQLIFVNQSLTLWEVIFGLFCHNIKPVQKLRLHTDK